MENCRDQHRGLVCGSRLPVATEGPRRIGHRLQRISASSWVSMEQDWFRCQQTYSIGTKKQAFQRCKGSGYSLLTTLQGPESRCKGTAIPSLQQTLRWMWDYGRVLTEYQVWVVYRVAVRQLNLYHTERASDSSCCKLQCCRGDYGTYLLDMSMRASMLAKAHLPLD